MDAAHQVGLPVASACSGHALCCRCGFEILEGEGNLSPVSANEVTRKRANRIPTEWRLSCKAIVRGPVTATARYW